MPVSLRPTRANLVAAGAAAVLSLVTSPFAAVWSLALGGAVALVSLLLVRWVAAARVAFFVGAGLVVGALPYLVLGLISGAFFGDAPSSSNSG